MHPNTHPQLDILMIPASKPCGFVILENLLEKALLSKTVVKWCWYLTLDTSMLGLNSNRRQWHFMYSYQDQGSSCSLLASQCRSPKHTWQKPRGPAEELCVVFWLQSHDHDPGSEA